jgi:hypothetical protein
MKILKRLRRAVYHFFRTFSGIVLDNFDTGKKRFPRQMKVRLAHVAAELTRRTFRFEESKGVTVIVSPDKDTA